MTDEDAHALRCEWMTFRFENGYEPRSEQRFLLEYCSRICWEATGTMFGAGFNYTNRGGEKEE